MAGIDIYIDNNRKEEFLGELLLHDSICGDDIKKSDDLILVQADISHDFIEYDLGAERSDAFKVIFGTECEGSIDA